MEYPEDPWKRKAEKAKPSPLLAVVEIVAVVAILRFVLELLWVGIFYFPKLGLPRLDDGLVSTLIALAAAVFYFIAGWQANQRRLPVDYAAKAGVVAGVLVALATYAVRRNGILGENLVLEDLVVKIAVEALMGAIIMAISAFMAGLVHRDEEEKDRSIRV